MTAVGVNLVHTSLYWRCISFISIRILFLMS